MSGIPPAISPDALLAKSQHFIATALAARGSMDASTFPLSAAIALELLAKAALGSKHPCLVVDVKNPNALFASVGIPVETRVATIGAHDAYARLKHLVPRFSNRLCDECKKLADARNAQLHSGEVPFIGVAQQTWEPDFWYAAELMLEFMDITFEDWLGAQGAALSKSVLRDARAARKAAVTTKITESKARFLTNFPSKKQQEEAVQKSASLSPYEYVHEFRTSFRKHWLVTCPACGSEGIAGGDHDETLLAEDQKDMDFGWERVIEVYRAGEFFCPTCGLHLKTDDEMYFAGIEETHDVDSEREIEWEPEYGND